MGFLDFFNTTPSQGKFAKLFIEAARGSGYSKSMKFDAEDFRLILDDNEGNIFNLHNAFRDYCRVPKSERTSVLKNYAANLNNPGIPDSFEEAKAGFMPSMRSKGQLEYIRLTNFLQKSEMPSIECSSPFSDDAAAVLAYDTEYSIATIGNDQLAKWNISFDSAMAIAMENLRDRTVDKFGSLDDGVMVGQWNDAYDSARVLLHDVIYRANVGGDPIMMVPTRGCFLLTSSTNIAGQRKMVDYARSSIENDGRFVSAGMYQIIGGKTVPFLPDDEEVIQQLKDLERINLAEDYASQKTLLEKIHDLEPVDIFVASYSLRKIEKTGRLTSVCAWTKGIDSLLPRTDVVALVIPDANGENHSVKMVAWSDAAGIAGDLWEVFEGYPTRYRTRDFPEAEKIELIPAAEF